MGHVGDLTRDTNFHLNLHWSYSILCRFPVPVRIIARVVCQGVSIEDGVRGGIRV
jgi:hypothetical protein